MSARSGIVKAMAEEVIRLFDGTGRYINNIYGNATNTVVHFDEVSDFPYISITPGPETRDDMPSHLSWAHLTVYIRIYVENNEDAQGELESLITDIETYVDTHLSLEYNDVTHTGTALRTTATNTIMSITTDEGLLDPNALGEVVLDVQYEKVRQT